MPPVEEEAAHLKHLQALDTEGSKVRHKRKVFNTVLEK